MDTARALKLLEGEDAVAAGEAALSLRHSKDISKAAMRTLVKHLGDEREAEVTPYYGPVGPPSVGDYVLDAIVGIGEPTVVLPLCKILADSDNEKARIRALKALKHLGSTARSSLCELTRQAQDENSSIRLHAIEAIRGVSSNPEEIIPPLKIALEDKDATVRSAAVLGLGSLGDEAAEVIPQLLPLLESSDERGIMFSADHGGTIPLRIDAAMTLGKIGAAAKVALPRLEEMLRDKDGEVRVAAAFAHCRISGKRKPGLDILLKELNGDLATARAAAIALGQLECQKFTPISLEALKNAIKHRDALVRCFAAESIGRIAPPDLVCILRPLSKDSSSTVQATVLKILREQATANPDPKLVEVFVECLERKRRKDLMDWLPRKIAAEALGKMGVSAASAVPVLRKCMNSGEDEMLRNAAKRSLERILRETGGN